MFARLAAVECLKLAFRARIRHCNSKLAFADRLSQWALPNPNHILGAEYIAASKVALKRFAFDPVADAHIQ